MADSCATCFFFRAYGASRGQSAGVTTCRNDAPKPGASNSSSPWVQVNADEWCGDGKDATTLQPFSPKAYSPTAPKSSGTFTIAASNTVNVVDATCLATSIINAFPITGGMPGVRFTPGAGSFDVFTDDGSTVTGTWSYLLY